MDRRFTACPFFLSIFSGFTRSQISSIMVVIARRNAARLQMYILYHLRPAIVNAYGSRIGSHTPPSTNTGTRQHTNCSLRCVHGNHHLIL